MATYYVSKTNGDDSRTSTQAQNKLTPWAHHPYDMGATGGPLAIRMSLQPGDEIIMCRGETHYLMDLQCLSVGTDFDSPILTATVPDFYVDAAGEPVLSGGVDPSNITWTLVSGNVYSAVVATKPKVVRDGAILLINNDAAGASIAVGEWAFSGTTLWVNVGQHPAGVDYSEAGTVAYNNRMPYNVFSDLVFEMGSYGFATTPLSTRESRTKLSNCLFRFCSTAGIYAGAQATGTHELLVDGSEIHDCSYGVDIRNTGLTVQNSHLHHNRFGVYGYDAKSNLFVANFIHDNWNGKYYGSGGQGGGLYFDGASEKNQVLGNRVVENYSGISFTDRSGAGGDLVAFNVVTNQLVNGISVFNTPVGADPITVINNTVIHNPSELNTPICAGHGIAFQNASGINSRKGKCINNLVVVEVATPHDGCHGIFIKDTTDPEFTELTMDYNCVYAEIDGVALGAIDSYPPVYTSIADWKTACVSNSKIVGLDGLSGSAEENTIGADPVASEAGKIAKTSPCVDAGLRVTGINDSLQTDPWGKKVYGLPNIGADQGAGMPATGSPQILDLGGRSRFGVFG